MAKEQIYNKNIVEFNSGIDLDTPPYSQIRGTRRFTLNAIEESRDGRQGTVQNEESNYVCSLFPAGYYPSGDTYIEDDTSVIILTNPTLDKTDIGILGKDNIYRSLVNTGVLLTKITHQCDIKYRLRRGNERVIYWVDGYNFARTLNLDRLYNFYNKTYEDYLKNGGDPTLFIGDKWDVNSFNLIKTYKSIPTFNNVQVLEGGNILPGSYNFGIQLVDEDLNPTAWITTSNTVNIYNDSTANPYERIRGSRNVTSNSQSFPRASKTIKLTLGAMDLSFPYYRVAIIRAAGNNGEPEKVLASDLHSTSQSTFLYTGNDANLSEVAIEDILIENEIIFAPKHIEQLENRLILANGRGKEINWCDFQKFASKIGSDLVTKEVILNSVQSDPNVKNAKSTFIYRGNMPGEVYSYGIVYIFPDTLSPAFHIPGPNVLSSSEILGHELSDSYLDIHSCVTDNYWGRDALGETLVGKPIRHHKFPFRKDIGIPLVSSTSSTTNITRYRLKATITLNPDWTPPPNVYPEVGGDPAVIDYSFIYQVNGAGSISSFNGILVDTNLGDDILIYDDSVPLDFYVADPSHLRLDPTCELAVTYQIGGNHRFLINQTYESYVLSSVQNADIGEIFGISFSRIERPHPECIGFYIVRNERTEDDRLIVDTALLGPMTEFLQYKSFGLIMPKQYYHVDNCGRGADSAKVLGYYNRASWFFNPEFQYFQKKTEFDDTVVEGSWNEDVVTMPTISNVTNSSCNTGGSRGVYINDVQAGTTYNPDVNKSKDKDDDGFDLIIGYRNTDVSFALNDSAIDLPDKERILYLNSASYQNYNDNTFYNVSVDNKIGMYITGTDIDTGLFYDTDTKKNSLIYAALTKANLTAYSNFLTRPYYKEHNNPVLFGDNTEVDGFDVFNGDAQISAFNFVSSVYYDIVVGDFPKKSSLWRIIVGAFLVVVATVVTIITAGAAAPIAASVAIAAIGALAISYGVSLAMSGFKIEQLQLMAETDYKKGLKDTITDGGVFETVREEVENEDDTIRWFADRVSNIYMESSVPFGLRSGLTSGVTDFTNSPVAYDEAGFRSYLTEKLTTVDSQQGSGRLYKGYATSEVYDMNLDYMRFNKQKIFFHLALEYDCCSSDKEIFPLRRWFSQQSFQEEKIDNYRVFLSNNYSDMEGEHGEITDMYTLGNNLYMHTREALWHQPANVQERTTNDIVSFIGTGDFLSILPRKIVDDRLGSAGTQHKWATIKTRNGVIFVNETEGKIYLHSQGLTDESVKGLRNWFEENLKSNLATQLYNKFGVEFPNQNNPSNPDGIGYLSTYDTRYERVLITKRDYFIIEEQFSRLVESTTPMAGVLSYNPVTGIFYNGLDKLRLSNKDFFENKSWTISYKFKSGEGKRFPWSSWHSYIPTYYIHSQNNLYSFDGLNGASIYKYGLRGSYGTFFGVKYPFIVEGVAKSPQDRLLEDITLCTEARMWDTTRKQFFDRRWITFDSIIIYNESGQCSGELQMVVKDTQPNPQLWYQQQLQSTTASILITRKDRDWHINGFRDWAIAEGAVFSTSWDDIRDSYYIDKVLNNSIIAFNKSWYDLNGFRDKYVVFRLKFNNFVNVNLILNYILDTEQISER